MFFLVKIASLLFQLRPYRFTTCRSQDCSGLMIYDRCFVLPPLACVVVVTSILLSLLGIKSEAMLMAASVTG